MTHTTGELRQMQSLPLELKIAMTERRIREFYDAMDGKVCVNFSGGKDSTVLLDLVRRIYPDIPAVFANTGLETPKCKRSPNRTKTSLWFVRRCASMRSYGNTDIRYSARTYLKTCGTRGENQAGLC